MNERIYFDNAATSFPKPENVYAAMDRYARTVGASAGRGAYQEALESGEIIDGCRKSIAELIHAADPRHIIMTFNCTDGLVLALKGMLTRRGRHVVSTRMEHNSILRPLAALQEEVGIEATYVPADGEGLVDPEAIRRAIKPNTAMIATVHGSNVCGSLQDIAALGKIAQEHGLYFLVDAAQSLGHLPLDVQELGIDFLAFPGHKGLLGPLGTGGLYIRPGLETILRPLKQGGTGSKSEIPRQPDFMPDRFESGSHNALGIAGLQAGADYIRQRGLTALRRHEEELCRRFLENTADIPRLTVYGPRAINRRLGVFSVRIEGYEPSELAAILESRFGLLTRPGLHCAPWAHDSIGTLDKGGTTRFSTGAFTTIAHIEKATQALRQIAQAK